MELASCKYPWVKYVVPVFQKGCLSTGRAASCLLAVRIGKERDDPWRGLEGVRGRATAGWGQAGGKVSSGKVWQLLVRKEYLWGSCFTAVQAAEPFSCPLCTVHLFR